MGRQIRFVEQNIDEEMTLKQEWQNIIDFLHEELRSKEKNLLMCEKFKLENNEKTTTDNEKRKAYVMSELTSKDTKCVLCS